MAWFSDDFSKSQDPHSSVYSIHWTRDVTFAEKIHDQKFHSNRMTDKVAGYFKRSNIYRPQNAVTVDEKPQKVPATVARIRWPPDERQRLAIVSISNVNFNWKWHCFANNTNSKYQRQWWSDRSGWANRFMQIHVSVPLTHNFSHLILLICSTI